MSKKAASGLDVLVANQFEPLCGLKVAIVANQATVSSSFQHLVDLLHHEPSVTVTRILAPEHGLRGALQDMEGDTSSVDPRTGLPIVTLYGGTFESLKPKPEYLADVDAVVIDLPDVGTRYYTFAQTMAFVMEVAGQLGKKVVVLDRPNPLNGVDIEGAPLLASYRSFCGWTPVANRHGLTLGELALVYQAGFGINSHDALAPIPCELEIVECRGWNRSQYFDETGLPWIIPSPNMPTLSAAIVYPGGCLFEATQISEARGTTKPFEYLGAPYIDGFEWAEAVKKEELPLEGAVLRPVTFIPKFQKLQNQSCGGVEIHVTDRSKFKSLRWGAAMISSLKRLYPTQFHWRTDPYEFVDRVPAIDLLWGSPSLRNVVEAGGSIAQLEAELQQFESWYREARKPFLRY